MCIRDSHYNIIRVFDILWIFDQWTIAVSDIPRKYNFDFFIVLSDPHLNAGRAKQMSLSLIHIWGAGYTYASGTGACAAASAAHKLGLVGNRGQVQMQGGDLLVEFAEDDLSLIRI